MAGMRARKGGRQPLNRSRSGDGLARVGRRPNKRRSSFVAVVVIFMVLVIFVVVATMQTTLQESPGSIRKRQLRREQEEFYATHNSDEHPPEEEEEEKYGGKYEDAGGGGVLEEIEAKEEAILEENRHQKEEEERLRREEEAEREKEEQIKQLEEEKQRLQEQLKEEETRLRKEDDLRRQREEEERQRKLEAEEREKETQLLKLEEEKNQLQQQLRDEAARRQREEEERQKQADEQQKPKTPRDAVHLERPKQNKDEPQLPGVPEQPKIDFCDFMRAEPDIVALTAAKDTGFSNPAVIVLGVEDTSTDLVWHVISQILFPNRKTARRTHELTNKAPAALDYSLLDKAGGDYQNEFWSGVSDKTQGKWMIHVFCQQQQHDIAAGFPWVTSPNKISDNPKARDTLELIKRLPKGSVKILRIKRNLLDVAIRHAQRDQQVVHRAPVQLDRKQIFHKLHELQAEQDAIDGFLQQHNIPHLALDFENLLPFDEWTDLVQSTQDYYQHLSHINVDWRRLATQLEATWRDVLRYIDVFKPLSMYDVLHYAMQTHEAHSFWTQKDSIDRFGYVQQALKGTHYQKLLRNQRPAAQPRKDEAWGEGDEM